jgi:hypothetical protein
VTDHDAYDEAVINESANAWLAEALRRMSRDLELIQDVRHWMSRRGQFATVPSVMTALADVLEGSGTDD